MCQRSDRGPLPLPDSPLLHNVQMHHCADAVVLYDPDWLAAIQAFVRSKLHRAYEAVVFARHPLVSLRHQHLALLSISLVQAASQLMGDQSTCVKGKESVGLVRRLCVVALP